MTIYSLDILLSQFETSTLLHVGSNCCFLTCVQVSQEAGKVVWYSHLFKNFPQLVIIHTFKDLSIFSEAEVDVFFWNSLDYFMIQQMLAIWSLVPLPFLIDLIFKRGARTISDHFLILWLEKRFGQRIPFSSFIPSLFYLQNSLFLL